MSMFGLEAMELARLAGALASFTLDRRPIVGHKAVAHLMVRKARNTPPGRRTPSADMYGAALDFMRAVWALDHALRSRSKRMKREIGLTGPQRLVLRLV